MELFFGLEHSFPRERISCELHGSSDTFYPRDE